MSKQPKKINQRIMRAFIRKHLSYRAEQGVSAYELASRALNTLGYSPVNETYRSFVIRMIGVIEDDLSEELPATHKKKPKKLNKESKRLIRKSIDSLKPYNHERLGEKDYGNFYKTSQWRQLRYLVLKNTDGKCCCCGASAKDGVQIHVDHIKPRSRYPELELSLDNMQVLCEDCNMGKGAWDDTSWI